GRVYRTFDSGEHWQLAPGPSGYSLLFTDSLTGYLGSTAVWKTTNGGDSWYQTNSPNTYGEINKIFFINNRIGWYVAIGGVIYKTTDYGENWFQQLYRSGAGFSSISFVDSLYGWASLGGWKPYKTTDGGLNWIEQTNLEFYNTYDVYFVNQDTGWIVDIFEGLNKTTNGGTNWSVVTDVIGPYNFNLFPDPSHWIINGSHIYITTDDGDSWNDITNDVPTGFNRFQAPTDFVGYSVGSAGLILKYDDTTYIPVELTLFSANVSGRDVLLKWTTATENNNRGFEVQRSGISSQRSEWKDIGFVEGNGTTTLTNSYSFIDQNVNKGMHFYRLKQIDFDGSYKYSKEIEIRLDIPNKFTLEQNYPNPFNPETNISFTIPEVTNVSIKLYDITGREIKVLVNEKKQPGYYTIKLRGDKLSSGVYFYRLTTSSGFYAIKKLMLLK
ncbi:MAG TPA: T9SS type A sorting domain-containing protein, partial [Ignavibacteriaceae bacterium]